MLRLQYCTRGRAARAGVDHTAGGMAEAHEELQGPWIRRQHELECGE